MRRARVVTVSIPFEHLPGYNAQIMGIRARREARHARQDERQRLREEKENARPLPDRIRGFRRRLASYLGTTTFLFGINAVTQGGTHHFWWAVFPALGMLMGVVSEAGNLWAAGARAKDVFGNQPRLQPGDAGASPPMPRCGR